MESFTKRKLSKRYKLSVKIATCATRVNMAATGQEKIIVIQIPQNSFPWKGFHTVFPVCCFFQVTQCLFTQFHLIFELRLSKLKDKMRARYYT